MPTAPEALTSVWYRSVASAHREGANGVSRMKQRVERRKNRMDYLKMSLSRPKNPFFLGSGSGCWVAGGVTGMLRGATGTGAAARTGCELWTVATSALSAGTAAEGAFCCTGSQPETKVRPLP